MPTMRSRVDCGFSLVMLSFWPMMRLWSVDLPAFGLPTTAIDVYNAALPPGVTLEHGTVKIDKDAPYEAIECCRFVAY